MDSISRRRVSYKGRLQPSSLQNFQSDNADVYATARTGSREIDENAVSMNHLDNGLLGCVSLHDSSYTEQGTSGGSQDAAHVRK